MREEEKLLRQKLSDVEKSRKQLQADVASRERSIQQLRAVSAPLATRTSVLCYLRAAFIFVSPPPRPSGNIF